MCVHQDEVKMKRFISIVRKWMEPRKWIKNGLKDQRSLRVLIKMSILKE